MKDLTFKSVETKDLDPQDFDKEFIGHYKDAISKAMDIQSKKQNTYNGTAVSYEDYLQFPNNYECLLYGKALRMLSIIKGSEVNFESLADTYLDMINYSAFCYASLMIKDGHDNKG